MADRYIATYQGGAFVVGPATATTGSADVQLHVGKGELLPQGVPPEQIAHLLAQDLIRKATRWDGVPPEQEEAGDE